VRRSAIASSHPQLRGNTGYRYVNSFGFSYLLHFRCLIHFVLYVFLHFSHSLNEKYCGIIVVKNQNVSGINRDVFEVTVKDFRAGTKKATVST
jgi:hypothetical protein